MNYFITDLDHCIIFPKKLKDTGFPEAHTEIYTRQNEPYRGAVMPNVLIDMIERVADKNIIITARPFVDVDKLSMPFNYEYAICSHGADIYQNGTIIHSLVNESGAASVAAAYTYLLEVEKIQKANKEFSVLADEIGVVNSEFTGTPAYIGIKLKDESDAEDFYKQYNLDFLMSDSSFNLKLLENGRTLTLIPTTVSKEHALSYMLENVINKESKTPFLIGAGDSHSDMPFMRMCHWCMTPSTSQIMQQPTAKI